jgi:hypothetical protein
MDAAPSLHKHLSMSLPVKEVACGPHPLSSKLLGDRLLLSSPRVLKRGPNLALAGGICLFGERIESYEKAYACGHGRIFALAGL